MSASVPDPLLSPGRLYSDREVQAPFLSRIRLSVAVAIASGTALALVIATTPRATARGEAALMPDLVTLGFHKEDLVVGVEKGKVQLRLNNEVANVGAGPLEINPSEQSNECDGDADPANDRGAFQRVYADSNASGVFERGADGIDSDRQFGCMRYHPRHIHWHVLDFTRYELRREDDGKLVRESDKVGFCLTDARRAFPLPDSPTTPVYPLEPGTLLPCDVASTQGISVGWADEYAFTLAGQQLDITALAAGRYCLTSRVDPSNVLAEADDLNNVRRAPILLRPDNAVIRRLDGRCQI